LQANPHPARKIPALVSMMRLPNCLMMGFAVIVGELIASQNVSAEAVVNGFAAGFFLLGAATILNDCFDREIDAINQPQRPIPAGIVKLADAISFAVILVSAGILFAAYSGVWTLLIAILSMVLTVAYNWKVKRLGLLGNAFVSTDVAISFIYGGFAVGSPTWSLGIFALLAFLASMGREIVKGIVDVTGDNAKGVRSLAATKGNTEAAKSGAALFLAAVALSVTPVVLKLVSNYYLPLVAICDIGFLLTAYSILTNPSPPNAERNKKYVLVWMTFGLLAFVIGSL
jgi:geranylgeranylglycerol-phosphate geranylgeranyltransferase